jgi:hypothetical protein
MSRFLELTAAFFCALCFVYAIVIAPYSWGSNGVMTPQAQDTTCEPPVIVQYLDNGLGLSHEEVRVAQDVRVKIDLLNRSK